MKFLFIAFIKYLCLFYEILHLLFKLYYEIRFFHKVYLHLAIEKGNLEIIKLLLSHPKIKVNYLSILLII